MNNVLDTEQHLNSVMTVIKDWMDVKQLNLNILQLAQIPVEKIAKCHKQSSHVDKESVTF